MHLCILGIGQPYKGTQADHSPATLFSSSLCQLERVLLVCLMQLWICNALSFVAVLHRMGGRSICDACVGSQIYHSFGAQGLAFLNGGIQSPYEALAYINHIPDAASTLHQDAGISGNGANKIDEGAHGLNHIANDIIQAANGADEEANGVSEGAAGAAQNGAARSLKRGAEEVADGSREAECSACGGAPGGAAPAESKAAAAATAHDAERMLSHADASTSGAAAPANGGEGANGVSIMANSVHQNGAQDAGSEERGNLAAPVAAHMVPPGVAAVEGVMIGRAAYNDPWGVLGNADKAVFGADSNPAISRRQVHTSAGTGLLSFRNGRMELSTTLTSPWVELIELCCHRGSDVTAASWNQLGWEDPAQR
eukprot:scaffold117196_cov17-Tisochrysis_lutea.AAC.2